MLTLRLTVKQKVVVTMHPITLAGTPAQVDGCSEWSIVQGGGTVESADDGQSAELVSADVAGTTLYMVTADVDLGKGFELVSDMIRVETYDPNALQLTAGKPEPKC